MLKDRCEISRVTQFFRFLGLRLIIAFSLVALYLVQSTTLRAQERVRTAAGRLQIQSFKNPEAFFTVGPLQEVLIGSTGFEFTDNSSLSHTGKISRLRFFEGLNLDTIWTLSELNQLEFNFGGQLNEDFYGNGTSQVSVGITPDSLVQFQFAAGDFLFHLYDHFSYVQDPTSDPTTANTTYLNNLTNTIGAKVDADFNLAILSLSADYTYNNRSGSNPAGGTSSGESGTRNSFRVSPSISFRLSPTLLYGIDASLTRSTGSTNGTTNGSSVGSGNINSLSVGPFIRGELSRFTDFNFSVGANLLDAKPSVAPDYYLSAVVRHQFNPNLQLILSASHDITFTTGTDLTQDTILQGGTQYSLTRFITLTASSFVDFGDVLSGSGTISNQGTLVAGTVPGNFKQYGIAAGVAWKPRKHLSTSLGYRWIRRDSESASNSYTENTITFQINYTF
jgi:opacity protein-like surface antigen